ncbi:hypothetical protein ACHAWO_006521 [Cyclotella atomus]|uniref:GRIP domain-containing protein n=1 Tax=Cyclotella atomus TaxID=382360 RepID=A0ABD3MW53_9STRA
MNEEETTLLTSTSSQSLPAASQPPRPAAASSNQMAKLREANAKYKNLLKMAKERIQEQEVVLEERRSEIKHLNNQLHEANQQINTLQSTAATTRSSPSAPYQEDNTTILRVCQRIKDETDNTEGETDETNAGAAASDDSFEIWALIEYEIDSSDNANADNAFSSPGKRFKQWKKFVNESALSDYIRRDTGEPLSLPPYSLSPDQSANIEKESKKAVASITEEFRRFRVRAEVAKKQADATVRALHSNSVQTTRMRIEGQDIESELAQAKLSSLRKEMAELESRWKESYDVLLAENEKLKSSGAEALLAAQWRHRYEACLKEKEDAVTNLEMEREKVLELQENRRKADAGKYETKYRDLKESFRLYRKKAKEIFLAQQQGETGFMPSLHDSGAENAKISYLKNLMVNYLGSDVSVRDHMEPAIATVLNFTEEELDKIKKAKGQSDSWW